VDMFIHEMNGNQLGALRKLIRFTSLFKIIW